MATHWSSQNVVAEHKSVPATAMSVDNSGSMALLAGRRFLGLVNLDEPNIIVRETTRGQNTPNKFDVKVVEWNPTSELRNYIAVAAGNDCEVYSVGEGGRLATENCLQAHVRGISDINWHRSEAHLLATASVESYLYLWDIREPRRPMSTLPATSGASQVKWNRQNSHLLASGHETDMRIWDSRKPDHPLLFLPAHASKVNSIDWSPHKATHIVSSAQDSTVRFFDILNARHPVNHISSEHPVWRAKYTPFGHGVLTISVPPLRGGDNSLLLWAADEPSAPVHCFMGHTDVVTNFDWRHNEAQGANDDCQLVSWGRDRCLRVWRLDQNMQSLCGPTTEFGASSDDAGSLDGGGSMTGAEMADESSPPHGSLSTSRYPMNPTTEDAFLTSSQSSPLVAATASLDLLVAPQDASPDGSTQIVSSIKTEPLINQYLEPRLTGLEDDGVVLGGASFGSTSTLVSGGSCRTSVTGVCGGRSSMVQTPTLSSSVPHESGFGMVATTSSTTSSVAAGLMDKKMLLNDELDVLRNTTWKNEAIHNIEVMCEASKRQVSVLAGAGPSKVGVVISLHAGYPNSQPLQVSFKPPTTFDRFVKLEIMNALNAVAEEYSEREENCLLPLVRTLLDTLALQLNTEGLSQHESSLPPTGGTLNSSEQSTEREGSLYSYGSFKDHSVPFPRTSGARFCGNGMLVCFTRPVFLSKKNQNKSAVIQTPRSLSALGAYIGTFKPFRANGGGVSGSKASKPYSPSLKPYADAGNFGSIKSSSKKASSLQKLRHQQQLQKQQQLMQVLQQDQKPQQPQRRKQQSLQILPPAKPGAISEPERGASSVQGAHSRTAPVYNGFLASSLGIAGRRDNDQEEDEYDEIADEDDREVGPADVSISKYYYHDRSKRRSRYKTNDKVGEVLVYTVEHLLPLCRTLAQQYRLDALDPMGTCLHNREVAQRNGRLDLVQVWALVAGIAQLRPNTGPTDSSLGPGLDAPWALHPLVRPTISKLIRHFIQLGDVQTAALLSCVFGTPCQQLQQELLPSKPVVQQQQHHHHHKHQHTSRRSHHQSSHQHKILDRLWRQTGGSPYNTIHGLNMKGETAHDPCPQVNRHNRSNSEGSLPEASRPPHDLSIVPSLADAPPSPSKTQITRFLPTSRCQQYEEIRRAYCNILYNWQLLDQRAEVLQYCSSTGSGAKEAGFLSECTQCQQLLRSHFCNHCKQPAVPCSVCKVPVRGHSVFCLWCGHGGHTNHLLTWFSTNDRCPAGCDCECISYFSEA